MNKILLVAGKDLQIIFRDRTSLILMLLAPYLITLGMGFVTGAFSEDDGVAGISNVPIVIVNADEGELGTTLQGIFTDNDELKSLFNVSIETDETAARGLVADDGVNAAILIPTGFSAGIIPSTTGDKADAMPIEVVANPNAPVSSGIVETIVTTFVDDTQANVVAANVLVDQIVSSGQVPMTEISTVVGDYVSGLNDGGLPATIRVNSTALSAGDDAEFSPLLLLAPGMALFFLMYTVTIGGRSILDEHAGGTMARLLAAPTSFMSVLGGKVLGVFVIGVVQMAILIVASRLMFGLDWGNNMGLLLIIVTASAAATGWGVLFAAFAKTPQQVGSIGSAVMLLFGILSGVFIPIEGGILRALGSITPNFWALNAFEKLGSGGSLSSISNNLLALVGMAVVLFVISTAAFSRKDLRG